MLRSIDDWNGEHFAFRTHGATHDAGTSVVTIGDGPHGPTATIPDAHLLFNAEFTRAGTDLILHGDDGKTAVVHDYFATDRHATLMSPQGATLSPAVVDALTGPQAAGQYAQNGAPQGAAQAVGRVAVVHGNAVIIRNGVAITLHAGDAVLKGDVLQTNSGTLGVTFNDGSTINLTANSRVVVDQFIYDAHDAAHNSEVLNLVQGSLSFISGEVAHSGGNMKIGTPVATMGIRGTVGGVTDASDGTVQFFVVQSDHGAVIEDNNGNVIAQVVQDGPLIEVKPNGPLQVIAEEINKSPAELAAELSALQAIVATQQVGQQIIQQFLQNPNPQSTEHHTQIEIDIPLNPDHDNGNNNAIVTVITTDDTNGGGDVIPPGPAPVPILTLPLPTNLPPVNFGPLQALVDQDQTLTFSTAGHNAITVTDPDTNVLTVTLTATNGTLNLHDESGLTFIAGDGQADPTMTFSGSQSNINAALNGLTYTPNSGYSGPASIQIQSSDGTTTTAPETIAIAVNPEGDVYLNWRHEIDPFAAHQGTATEWIVPNLDNLTSTVFTGIGFTYDPTTGLPTGGTITSMSLVDYQGHTLQAMTGITTTLGQLGAFVAGEEALRGEIPWADVFPSNADAIFNDAGTQITIVNTDATQTEIIGSGLSQIGGLHGTVTEIEQLDENGNPISGHDITLDNLSLAQAAAALSLDETSDLFFLLAGQGSNTLTGYHAEVGTTNFFYTNLDPSAGGDTINGQPLDDVENQNFVNTVDYSDAPMAVCVNLVTGVVTGGFGSTDILANINGVSGTDFNDILIANNNGDWLDGGLGNDHLFGGEGNDTLHGGPGADVLNGGGGINTADYQTYDNENTGVTVDLADPSKNTGDAAGDTYINIQNLTGSQYADVLEGDSGPNVLTGGGGADTFVYVTGGGADTIADFDQGNSGTFSQDEGDRIDLTGVDGIRSFSDVLNHVPSSADAQNTVIDFGGGDSLTLQNVKVCDLNAGDFIFNAAPVITDEGPQTVNEDSSLVFSSAKGNAISVSDSDNDNLIVTLIAAAGTLTLSETNGLAFTQGDGQHDSTMTFSGSQADINAALNGLTYKSGEAGNTTLTVQVDDGHGAPVSDTINVTVTPEVPNLYVNDSTLNVAGGSSVGLGIVAFGNDLDDHVSVTITGLSSTDTLTDLWHDNLAITNGSITLTPLQLTGLELHTGTESLDTLTVTATNLENGVSASTSQDITVNVDHHPPNAVADHVITNIGNNTPFQIPDSALLANDSGGDSQHPLVIDNVGLAFSGSVSQDGSNVTFDDTGFLSGGSFVYQISDGILTDSASVTVTHTSGNLTGTSGDDILISKNGNFTIDGEGGNDTLISGVGNNTLTGGVGADTFVFNALGNESSSSTHATITDFTAAQGDHIELDNFASITNFSDLSPLMHDISGHHATQIDLPNDNTITLLHVNANTLTAADFVIHPPLIG